MRSQEPWKSTTRSFRRASSAGRVDLAFQQTGNHTVVIPLRREGPVSVRTVR